MLHQQKFHFQFQLLMWEMGIHLKEITCLVEIIIYPKLGHILREFLITGISGKIFKIDF